MGLKFINRHRELSRLGQLLESKDAEMAVIWGRRRVGKTRLLLEWTEQADGVYFVADESAATIQRNFFAEAIGRVLPGFSEVNYPDWNALLARLAREAEARKWRGPIVIDELPYLVAASPELPSVLQKWIDHAAKQARLIVVLCGSSQRMMQGAVLDESAPLYGRATELIKLSPIEIGYMGKALQLKTARSVIEAYSIWGGIPRYWELVSRCKGSLLQAIDQLVLDPMGPLHEEPQRLLREEMPSALYLKPILDAIGLGAHRLSEVASRLNIPATSLSRPIDHLMELDLIQREVPYGTNPENSKKALYKIKDPFLRFWFQVVAPKRSLFSQVSTQIRLQWLKEGLPKLFSLTWEELCRQSLPILSEHWETIYEPASRFWHKQQAEWDLVSESHDHSHVLLGEAKWTEKSPSARMIAQFIGDLKNKGIPHIERHPHAQIRYVLFVSEKPPKLSLDSNVRVVDAKELLDQA